MIAILCLCVSGSLEIYTFAGYPALLWLRSRLRPRPVAKGNSQPTVTVLIAAHNEERVIKRKLDSIFSSNYPPNKLDVIVLADGSSDATNPILFAYNDSRVSTMLQGRIGKAAALNIGMRQASGELVVFTDARQVLDKNCLRELVANFADPSVGCVSGQLMIGNIIGATEFSGEQMKWKLENAIRNWEGMAGSCIWAPGDFYGVRRRFVVDIPPRKLLGDCFLPLPLVRLRFLIGFVTNAPSLVGR